MNGFRQTKCTTEFTYNDKLHSINGPARTVYYDDNKTLIKTEEYYHFGKLHREDGPAYIIYHKNGLIEREVYYINGEEKRNDGPSYIIYFDTGAIHQQAYTNSIMYPDERVTISYYPDGSLQFEQHRCVYNNARHNRNGPSHLMYDKNGECSLKVYYINDVKIPVDQAEFCLTHFDRIINSMSELPKSTPEDIATEFKLRFM